MELNDVTLREGDQMPGRTYSVEQKIKAGKKLDELGLHYIQAGFPVTGQTDREVVSRLSESVSADVIGLARAVPRDIEAALEAEPDIIEIFGPLSDLHLEYSVGMTKQEMDTAFKQSIQAVVDHGIPVHLTFVDAFRTQQTQLAESIALFDDVNRITLADSVGVRTPKQVQDYLNELPSTVDLEQLGVHFHDDLGVATANTLAAIDAGVSKVDVSVASIGERAGNTALEELVASMSVGGDIEWDQLKEKKLIPCCEAVLDALGEEIPERKPILGDSVAEHESGIHTAAMLKEPSVFEPFDPATFGGQRRLLFGTQTGRDSARQLVELVDKNPSTERVETLRQKLEKKGPVNKQEAKELANQLK